ncbi:MAG TPA: PLP-dependent aspartate aminotransferase family protein [Verrucomicrobiae bacterium]|nr:PLP-dependent aspartate aminotransferase family protein [Verrucomicrobiae bacterium]
MERETLLAQAGSRWDDRTGAVSMPIYQTATFRHPALGESTGFDYSRSGNPTRQVLEETVAALDAGARGLAFSSGLAAVDCVLRLFSPGDRIAVTEDLYGGTFRLFEKIYRPLGLEAVYVDTSDTAAVARVLESGVAAIFVENPTNPLLKVADLREICRLAREAGAVSIVDNTFLTGYLQRPLELGADITLYSGTKYLAGHNDLVSGFLVAREADMGERLYFYQNACGAVPGPQDCWLMLRGLKTLPLRLRRQQENALKVAEYLSRHPRVRRVFYPGLAAHPGHDLLSEQGEGFGAMLSFEVDDPGLVPQLLRRVGVFLFAESLGGVESLITFPSVQTHADIDPEIRARLGINDRLLRVSVGIEAPGDLLAALEQALLPGEE